MEGSFKHGFHKTRTFFDQLSNDHFIRNIDPCS